MINLETLEQQYQILRRDFQAGKLDEATFAAAVDRLGFQDEQGRCWLIGLQTGAWYYYDGQNWHVGNPRTLPPLVDQGYYGEYEESGGDYFDIPTVQHSQALPIPLKFIAVVLMAFGVLLALLIWPVGHIPSAGAPALAPSPRPPINQPSGGGGSGGNGSSGGSSDRNDDGGSSNSGAHSAIFGKVTDLSTGQPGVGVEVSVNGSIVRTDGDGSYSITGLQAGEYIVQPQLQGQGTTAEEAVLVSVDGQNSVTVDLAYYSDSKPIPTDTPSASVASLAEPPPSLPDSGGAIAHRPLTIIGLGLLLAFVGGILFRVAKD
jgi:hypothetical protein